MLVIGMLSKRNCGLLRGPELIDAVDQRKENRITQARVAHGIAKVKDVGSGQSGVRIGRHRHFKPGLCDLVRIPFQFHAIRTAHARARSHCHGGWRRRSRPIARANCYCPFGT